MERELCAIMQYASNTLISHTHFYIYICINDCGPWRGKKSSKISQSQFGSMAACVSVSLCVRTKQRMNERII